MTSSKKINSVAAIIPFYNEGSTIKKIVNRTIDYVDYIIAVDDGSTEKADFENLQNEKVTVIKFDNNHGKGFALAEGLKRGCELGYKSLITIDADLQHDPSEIPYLLNKLSEYDIVIGNRLNDLTAMPLQRRMSNAITSLLLSIKTGQKLIDSQCGFRAFRSDVVKNVKTYNSGYEAESEMLIKASRKNYKIGFVDISTIYGNEKSKMNPFEAIFGFIKILFI